MKKSRFVSYLVVIQLIFFISGCKWTILSVNGPKCASTGETVTIYVEGTSESEENSPTQYGLILQIPDSWLVLSATAEVSGGSYNLTENAEYASLYTAESGQKVWVGTATQTSNVTTNGIATVVLMIGDTSGQVKVAAGSYRNGAWTTDDPAGQFDFANITEQKYIHSISTADTCIPASPPTPTSVNPASGFTDAVTEITVYGSNFLKGGVAGVTIGGNWISYTSIAYAADGSWLRFNAPEHSAGTVDITVRNPDSQEGTLADGYTYIVDPSAPTITSIDPVSGPSDGGTTVTIKGSNFDNNIYVSVCSFSGVDVSDDGTSLTCVTGSHPAGVVDVMVQNPDYQSATLEDAFTYYNVSPAPTITSIDPVSGPSDGGTTVTIKGSNFDNNIYVSVCSFSGVDVSDDGTSLTCVTGSHPAGVVDVMVQNPDYQSAILGDAFTYYNVSPAPTITSIDPVSGPSDGGTTVTIKGSNFDNNIYVSVCSFSGVDVSDDGTSLTCVTGSHPAGVVDVMVQNPDYQSAILGDAFTYYNVSPAPTITSIDPVSGPSDGGTTVTIKGSNFDNNIYVSVCSFSGVDVSDDGTSLTCVTGSHPAGVVDVMVQNPDYQSATLGDAFTYYNTPSVIYINAEDSTCSGNSPCFTSIQEGIEAAKSETLIKVTAGYYNESPYLNETKVLTIQGGWNTSYVIQTPGSTVIRIPSQTSIKANKGSLKFENLSMRP